MQSPLKLMNLKLGYDLGDCRHMIPIESMQPQETYHLISYNLFQTSLFAYIIKIILRNTSLYSLI